MKYQLEIKEAAANEIREAFTWYEERKEGLGSEFVSLLEQYLDRITEKPFLYPKTVKERVAVMDGFPYKIVYGVEKELVIVYAVFHTSRDPKGLKR